MRIPNFQLPTRRDRSAAPGLPGSSRTATCTIGLMCFVAFVSFVVPSFAAGKSEVADAAMKGDKAAVRALIANDRRGVEDHGMVIWTLLTTELWFRTFFDRNPSLDD